MGVYQLNFNFTLLSQSPKRESLVCINKYIPINDASKIHKVYGSIVYDATHDHLPTTNLLYPVQDDFQMKRSCPSCQLRFSTIFMHAQKLCFLTFSGLFTFYEGV